MHSPLSLSGTPQKILPDHILDLHDAAHLVALVDDPENGAAHQERLAPTLSPHLQDPLSRIADRTVAEHADPVGALDGERALLAAVQGPVQVGQGLDAAGRDDVVGRDAHPAPRGANGGEEEVEVAQRGAVLGLGDGDLRDGGREVAHARDGRGGGRRADGAAGVVGEEDVGGGAARCGVQAFCDGEGEGVADGERDGRGRRGRGKAEGGLLGFVDGCGEEDAVGAGGDEGARCGGDVAGEDDEGDRRWDVREEQ